MLYFFKCAFSSHTLKILNLHNIRPKIFSFDIFCLKCCLSVHSYFSNSSGMKESGLWNSWCAPISLKMPWSCFRAPHFFLRYIYIFFFIDSTNRCKFLHILKVESEFWRRKYFWALEQLHEGFSDIGAHQEFQKHDSCLNY